MPWPTGVHALVRRTHEERVLSALRQRGALTRTELASAAGLSRTTLSEIVQVLLAHRAVVVTETDATERAGSGRPAQRLALDPASGQFMGVEFSHERVRVIVVDASHEVLAAGAALLPPGSDWGARTRVALDLTDDLSVSTGAHYEALQAVGVGIPGLVLRAGRGPADCGPGAPPAGRVRSAFEEHFGADVTVCNNTRLAALAAAITTPNGGSENLLYVRLAQGVGGGLVVGGRLVAGADGLAGEVGHVRVEVLGERCRCGKRGCLETVASVPAVLAACRAGGADVQDLDDLGRAPVLARADVHAVLERAGEALGQVLASAVTLLNPAHVVIGGEIATVAPALVATAARVIAAEATATAPPTVQTARPGDDDGARGAIVAALQRSPLLVGVAGTNAAPILPMMTRRSS